MGGAAMKSLSLDQQRTTYSSVAGIFTSYFVRCVLWKAISQVVSVCFNILLQPPVLADLPFDGSSIHNLWLGWYADFTPQLSLARESHMRRARHEPGLLIGTIQAQAKRELCVAAPRSCRRRGVQCNGVRQEGAMCQSRRQLEGSAQPVTPR